MRRNDVGGHESQLLSLKLSEMDSHIQGFASRFDKDGSKRVGSKKSFMDSGQEGEEGGEGKAPQGTLSPEIQRRLRLNRPEFDPAEIVTNSGWLHKKGDKRRNWTKRFFMFDAKKPYHLSYRAKPTDKRSKGDITLSDHASVTCTDDMRNTKNKKVPVYHFELRAKDTLSDTMRVYEMAAESEEAMMSWIHTLNYIIGQVKAYVDLRKMKRDGLLPLDGPALPPQEDERDDEMEDGEGDDDEFDEDKQAREDAAQDCRASGSGLTDASSGAPAEIIIMQHDEFGAELIMEIEEREVEMPEGSDNWVWIPLTKTMEPYHFEQDEEVPFQASLQSDNHSADHDDGGNHDLHYDLPCFWFIDDQNRKRFKIEYTASRPGKYVLNIMHMGCHIYGSPFHPTVAGGTTNARECVVRGDGTTQYHTNAPNKFTVIAHDALGNKQPLGGDYFDVEFRGPAILMTTVDNEDGTYDVEYKVGPELGNIEEPVEISVRVGANEHDHLAEAHPANWGRHIQGSPFMPQKAGGGGAGGRGLGCPMGGGGMMSPPPGGGRLGAGAPPSPGGGTPSSMQAMWAGQQQAHLQVGGVGGGGAPSPKEVELKAKEDHLNRREAEMAAERKSMEEQMKKLEALSLRAQEDSEKIERAAQQRQQRMEPKKMQLQNAQPVGGSKIGGGGGGGGGGRGISRFVKSQIDSGAGPPESGRPTHGSGTMHASGDGMMMGGGSPAGGAGRLMSIPPPPPAALRSPPPAALSPPGGMGGVRRDLGSMETSPAARSGGGRSPAGRSPAGRSPAGPSSSSSSPAASRHGMHSQSKHVQGLFAKYHTALEHVFNHYSAGGVDGSTVSAMQLLRMSQDYDLHPTFLTKAEIRMAFSETARVMGTGSDLDYNGFIEVLSRIAIVALSKPVFSHLYPTEADKIGVLLEMWGVADPLKLQQVQGMM